MKKEKQCKNNSNEKRERGHEKEGKKRKHDEKKSCIVYYHVGYLDDIDGVFVGELHPQDYRHSFYRRAENIHPNENRGEDVASF